MLQIGPDTVREMTDEDLVNFGITRFGDRVAIRSYVRVPAQDNTHEMPVAGSSGLPPRLLDLIKDRSNDKPTKKEKLAANKNAKKSHKSFEMGWLMDNGNQVKQVRQRSGGGTRKIKAPLTSTGVEVLGNAVNLFFPGGTSKFGNADDFHFNLCLFDETVIDDLELTISDIVGETKMTNLRLYLLSKKRDGLPRNSSPVREIVTSSPSTGVQPDMDEKRDDLPRNSSPVREIVTRSPSTDIQPDMDEQVLMFPPMEDYQTMQGDTQTVQTIDEDIAFNFFNPGDQ